MEKFEYIIVAYGQIQESFDSYSMAYKYLICHQYEEAEILQVVTKYKYKKNEVRQ